VANSLFESAQEAERRAIVITDMVHGWVMDGATALTKAAAQAEAIAMLASLDGSTKATGTA
jgi:predicted house-cleaning NTP pyrophosphatase (Maf/HAM1 superfamily)